jgi:hypothetical protein
MNARRARFLVSGVGFSLAAIAAAFCAYYLLIEHASEGGGSWSAEVAAARALLQAMIWARLLIVAGVASLFTYPFALLGRRTLLEKSGLISRDWKKAVMAWSFVVSCTLLALVAVLNYYANAANWTIRSDLLQMMLFLGLSQFNTAIYQPVGIISSASEIAKWFAMLLLITLISLFSIRVRLGLKKALLDTIGALLICLFLYEVGLVLLSSNFDYVWVTALQAGTSFQWFSNVDLLCVSASGVAALVLMRLVSKVRSGPPGGDLSG